MKRLFALLLAVMMILCACGGNEPAQTTGPVEQTTASATEGTTEAPTTEVPETTTPAGLLYNPLTGEPLDAPYTGTPTAVVINNIKACMPQSGLQDADMVFEVETEGGITRLLALYADVGSVGTIGPVRSARTYFNNLAEGYKSVLMHCGGSVNALNGRYDETNALGFWRHIDQRFNGKYFYRDQDRKDEGYNTEHTLFTTGELLEKALNSKGYTEEQRTYNYGMQFAESVSLNGEPANKITVDFRGSKTTSFTYNKDLGLYEASQYKKDHIDENTGKAITYRNVLVLQTEQRTQKEGTYNRSYYELEGEGTGYFACDGQIIPIKWSRKSVSVPFVYTLTDGTPLTLGIGNSYVGVIHNGSSAGVEYK